MIKGVGYKILTQNNLIAIDGCLKKVVDMVTGVVYHIPNYCICEPTFIKKLDIDNTSNGAMLNVTYSFLIYIKLKMNDFYGNKTTLIQILSTSTGYELKTLYAKLNKLDLRRLALRLIYKGFEITNDLILNQIKYDEISNITVIMRLLTDKKQNFNSDNDIEKLVSHTSVINLIVGDEQE